MQQQVNHPPEKKANLEDLVTKMADNTNKFINETRTTLQSQASQIRSLETQINQLAMASSSRPQGTLPSNTETNPKDHCNAVTLRNGKELVDQRQGTELVKNSQGTVSNEAQKQTHPMVPATKEKVPNVPYPQRLKNVKLDK